MSFEAFSHIPHSAGGWFAPHLYIYIIIMFHTLLYASPALNNYLIERVVLFRYLSTKHVPKRHINTCDYTPHYTIAQKVP
jgi:hypothetical protein